jgi:hypothetical protein
MPFQFVGTFKVAVISASSAALRSGNLNGKAVLPEIKRRPGLSLRVSSLGAKTGAAHHPIG